MRAFAISFAAFVLNAAWAGELKLPREFESPASLALSAAPEFAAAGLLRMIESGRVKDKETAIVMLDQAFNVASHAHFQMAMRETGSGSTDTRAGSLAKSYSLNLDAASLQSRAVLAMIRFDAVRAREMFQSMTQPELPALTCKDSLVYDVGALYRALGAVARSGFSAKERARQDHVSLLLGYGAAVHAPAQLQPMLAAIQEAGLSPAEFSAVAVALSGRMESMAGDPRSFAATLNDLSKGIPAELSASFQKYVAQNQSGAVCKPNEIPVEAYWQSATAQRLVDGARKLRFGDNTTRVLSDTDRAKSEWKQQLADFEKGLAGWEPAAEKSEMDYYQQKCIVYQAMVELIPAGSERDGALQSFFAFVSSSNLQTQSPPEWFMPVAQMLQRVRNTNGGEPEKVLAAMEASGNPALSLFAALERVFDAGYPSWVTAGSGR